MTRTLTTAAAPAVDTAAVDPVLARAEFLFDLDLLELTSTIPQATPTPAVARY